MNGDTSNKTGSGAEQRIAELEAALREVRQTCARLTRENALLLRRHPRLAPGAKGPAIDSMLDAVRDTVFVFEPATGKPIRWNRAFEEVSGCSAEEIAARRAPDDWYSPEDVRRAAAYLEQLQTGDAPPLELELITRSGARVPFEYDSTPLADDAGELRYLIVVGRDVSERRRRQDALRESERRYREIFTKAPAMLHSIDPEGRLLNVSDQWLERLGYAREEVIGHRSSELLTEESRRYAVEEVLPAFFRTGSCTDIPYRFVAKNGEEVDVLLSAISEKDEQGAVLRSVAVLIDVTERKRIEQENVKLGAQLLQSQKMEAIGRLAGGVAHDFNNLLTGITGNVDLAKLDLDERDPLFATLEEIDAAALRAANLTRQLLAFSRRQLIKPKVIDLNELLQGLHRLLVRIIGEDIELLTLPSQSLGRIRADPGQVEQIVVNLAVNARDAMPRGGRLLIETGDVTLDESYCRTHPQVTPGDYVLLALSDSGEGMDEETRDHIFEPFFTTKEKGQGTGLGLSTVYGIVKQHQGHIEVYSEPGHGTTLRVYFPQVLEEAEQISRPVRTATLPGGTETVLVVEDDATVRNIAVRTLRRLGYEVLHSHQGDDALRQARGHEGPIHLLLTDVIMPGMNGRELGEELQRIRPDTLVLYTSGYTENVIAHHGVLEEGLQFLGKPYTPMDLATKVRRVLDGVRS